MNSKKSPPYKWPTFSLVWLFFLSRFWTWKEKLLLSLYLVNGWINEWNEWEKIGLSVWAHGKRIWYILLLLCPCPLLLNAVRVFIFYKYRILYILFRLQILLCDKKWVLINVLLFIDAHSFMHNLLCSVWLSLLFEIDKQQFVPANTRTSTIQKKQLQNIIWSLWWFDCSILNENSRTKKTTTIRKFAFFWQFVWLYQAT